jgi:hypothetical protein
MLMRNLRKLLLSDRELKSLSAQVTPFSTLCHSVTVMTIGESIVTIKSREFQGLPVWSAYCFGTYPGGEKNVKIC